MGYLEYDPCKAEADEAYARGYDEGYDDVMDRALYELTGDDA